MTEKRDMQLGDALRKIGSPQHGEDFFAKLWEAVGVERKRSELVDVAEKETGATSAPQAGLRAGRGADSDRGIFRRLRPAWVLAAAAAACAALVLGLFGVPGVKRSEPQQATAATVLAAIDRLAPSLRSVVAEYVQTEPSNPARKPATFTVSLLDDTSWVQRSQYGNKSYSAHEGLWRQWSSDGNVTAGIVEGVDLQASFGVLYMPYYLYLRAASRALMADHNVPAESVTYQGRPAWRLRLPRQQGDAGSGGPSTAWLVTFDKATGFLVQSVDLRGDQVLWQTDVTKLSINTLDPHDLKLFDFPPGTQHTIDAMPFGGYRKVSLTEAARAMHMAPLLPTKLPSGFNLAAVTVPNAQKAGLSGPFLSLLYTRGVDAVGVDLYIGGSYQSSRIDPIGPSKPSPPAQEIHLKSGALAGENAHILVDLVPAPHLYVNDTQRRLNLTIFGDLTREELIAAAQSLTEWKPGLSFAGVSVQ